MASRLVYQDAMFRCGLFDYYYRTDDKYMGFTIPKEQAVQAA